MLSMMTTRKLLCRLVLEVGQGQQLVLKCGAEGPARAPLAVEALLELELADPGQDLGQGHPLADLLAPADRLPAQVHSFQALMASKAKGKARLHQPVHGQECGFLRCRLGAADRPQYRVQIP